MNHPDPGKAFFEFFSRSMAEGFANRALKDAFKNGTFTARTVNSGVLQDFQSAYTDLLTKAQQAKAVREDIEVRDLITLMFGLLQAIEQPKGARPDIDRFKRLVSIVSDGLLYKDTFK